MIDFFKCFFWKESWNIFLFKLSGDVFLNNGLKGEKSFSFDSNKSFFADPFLIEEKGKLYLFYEKLSLENKGELWACSCVKNKKRGFIFEDDKLILSKSFHLSYPFVFRQGNAFYLMPEASDSGELSLYKAVDFPYNWVKVKTLLSNFPAVDATFFDYNNKKWIFCGKKGSENNDLYIFHADNLMGPWIAHKKNPVKSDVSSSRSAGNVLFLNDKLFRPSQNCEKTYGGSLKLNEIVKLNEGEFEEKEIFEQQPFDKVFSKGLHNISFTDGFLVVDAKRFLGLKRFFGDFYLKVKNFLKDVSRVS